MKLATKLLSTHWLQQMVADRYNVYPVDSDKAYEDFICADFIAGSDAFRLTHYTFRFGIRVDKSFKDVDKVHAELVAALWRGLGRAWPPGTAVMWRLRPVIGEEPYTPGRPRQIYIRCRLGSFAAPKPGTYAPERSRERKCPRKKK